MGVPAGELGHACYDKIRLTGKAKSAFLYTIYQRLREAKLTYNQLTSNSQGIECETLTSELKSIGELLQEAEVMTTSLEKKEEEIQSKGVYYLAETIKLVEDKIQSTRSFVEEGVLRVRIHKIKEFTVHYPGL